MLSFFLIYFLDMKSFKFNLIIIFDLIIIDEGVKPIFDREELRLPKITTNEEVEERRTVKTIESERSGTLTFL